MSEPGYDATVERLLTEGWALRCGNCRRRLDTEHGRKLHLVYGDLSGRCLSGQNDYDDLDLSTNFFADPFESSPVISLKEAQ